MSLDQRVALHVCTTCRVGGAAAPAKEVRDGAHLLTLVEEAVAASPSRDRIALSGIACMSGCNRACTVALSAPGKPSYLFGDLPPDEETASQALAVALLYGDSDTGVMLRPDRPARFHAGILARIPPPTA